MALVSQIITDAFRESNILPIGQLPSAAEQTEALSLFNRFLSSVYGTSVSDSFTTINFGNANISSGYNVNLSSVPSGIWSPPPNTRLAFNNTSVQTVNLNPNPQDGERFSVIDMSNNFATYPVTLVGNGRTIGGALTSVLNTNSLKQDYFFRADIGDWKLVSPLQLTDTFPFPVEFEDLFVLGLALRINPRNGVTLDNQSSVTFKRLFNLFRARYAVKTEVGSEYALVRLPSFRRATQMSNLDAAQRFNTGLV